MENENHIPDVYICGIGMVTAVGDSAAMTAASVRAGINRYKDSKILNKHFYPMSLAILPEEILPDLSEKILNSTNLPSRQRRLLKLLDPAFKDPYLNIPADVNIPLFLAGPENLPNGPNSNGNDILEHVKIQSGINIDLEQSMYFTTGRAGALIALEAAMILLAHNQNEFVLLGGVDTYYDLLLLSNLDNENRVKAEAVLDGFAPGEGAGFLLLASADALQSRGIKAFASLSAPGISSEPGHRYSEEPYRGDGLAQAFDSALNHFGEAAIKTIFASLNGENFGAKEYGVALARNHDRFDPGVSLEHPADCFGDIGAAFAPVLIGLACIGQSKGYIKAPSLIYCSSEGEYRGATCVNYLE